MKNNALALPVLSGELCWKNLVTLPILTQNAEWSMTCSKSYWGMIVRRFMGLWRSIPAIISVFNEG